MQEKAALSQYKNSCEALKSQYESKVKIFESKINQILEEKGKVESKKALEMATAMVILVQMRFIFTITYKFVVSI